MSARRDRLFFLAGALAVGAFAAFSNYTLTLWLVAFSPSYIVLSLLGNTRSGEGAVVGPLVGAWSDRTWLSRLGRRRPFILVGGLGAAALLAITPALGRSPLPPSLAGLPAVAASVFGATFLLTTLADTHKALLVDLTADGERTRLSSIEIAVEMIGQVGFLLLGALVWRNGVPDQAFGLAAAIIALATLAVVLGVREQPPRDPTAERAPIRDQVVGLWRWPLERRHRSALFLCVVMLLYWTGVNAVLPLLSVYCRDILHASVSEAQLLPALLLISTLALAVPVGWLGSHWGKQRVLGCGLLVMALAGLAALGVTSVTQGALVFVLAGAGTAAVLVLSVPLLAELVSPEEVGMGTGVLAASGSIAAPLASLLGGALADAFGPRAVFGVLVIGALAALAVLPRVRSQRAAEAGVSKDGPDRALKAFLLTEPHFGQLQLDESRPDDLAREVDI